MYTTRCDSKSYFSVGKTIESVEGVSNLTENSKPWTGVGSYKRWLLWSPGEPYSSVLSYEFAQVAVKSAVLPPQLNPDKFRFEDHQETKLDTDGAQSASRGRILWFIAHCG